jgi:cytochrome c oxidase subunit 2
MSRWWQSVLDAAGPQSGRILTLWRFALPVSIVVFALVVAALLWATFRRRDAAATSERRLRLGVVGASALTVAVLFVFLFIDLSVGRALTRAPRPAAVIHVVGHQWWWEIEYDDSVAQRHVRTANEIHVPVGKPVLLQLDAADVIHSFWVPSLSGKLDLIPGHPNSLWFRADTVGVYRGPCAEFCGLQHAKMALVVVAHRPDDYAAWYESQLEPPPQPTDSSAAHGQKVFLSGTCVMCHSIDGTPAGSTAGPTLTHVASRLTIGAGTLPMTRGNLAGWIVDPQGIKPGARMPPNQLSPGDLQALLDYLETLR